MTGQLQAKLDRLKEILSNTGGCAVACSGGVDSSFLLAVAREVLGRKCIAVIAGGPIYPAQESAEARRFAAGIGVKALTIESDVLSLASFRENPPDRCYWCKKYLFSKVKEVALAEGFETVADGTNADDLKDYRPGLRALTELGILSPLKEAGLTKSEIRAIAGSKYQLPEADKPAMACLASRVPYGSPITVEKLEQIAGVEAYLSQAGFRVYRARHHDHILRIELETGDMPRVLRPEIRNELLRLAKGIGFKYVVIDLEGYRTGSLNEMLAADDGGP